MPARKSVNRREYLFFFFTIFDIILLGDYYMTSNEYKELILSYLNNPGRYDHFSFHDGLYVKNRDLIFGTMLDEKNPSTPAECASYLYGKAAEAVILSKVRKEIKRIWLTVEEVTSKITFNLPKCLEDYLIEMLDGCENAIEEFISEENPDIKNILLDIQYIAERIITDEKYYDESFNGHSISEIAFPSELYIFANNVVLKELTKEGYKVNGISDNLNSPVSCILTSPEGEKMVVLEQVTVAPEVAKFPSYLKAACKKAAIKEDCDAYLLGVQIEPQEEDIKNSGIALKQGKQVVKRTNFIKVE